MDTDGKRRRGGSSNLNSDIRAAALIDCRRYDAAQGRRREWIAQVRVTSILLASCLVEGADACSGCRVTVKCKSVSRLSSQAPLMTAYMYYVIASHGR